MKLIADSGSTKTDWRLLDGSKVEQFRTEGLNPNYITDDLFVSIVESSALKQYRDQVQEVFFYGSGCGSESNIKTVSNSLQLVFTNATITVGSDILGAARGVAGREKGVCCILGTGSNACVFDGEKIIEKAASFGFVLGDEGSGFDLGKRVIKDFFAKKMPDDLSEKFQKRYQPKLPDLIKKLYEEEKPNTYIAGFSKFLFDHRKTTYGLEAIRSCFTDFITYSVKPLNFRPDEVKVHFVGSIAFYYNDILRKLLQENGYITGNIIETPIAGLTLYHSER